MGGETLVVVLHQRQLRARRFKAVRLEEGVLDWAALGHAVERGQA